jgi:hypothetical protein
LVVAFATGFFAAGFAVFLVIFAMTASPFWAFERFGYYTLNLMQ